MVGDRAPGGVVIFSPFGRATDDFLSPRLDGEPTHSAAVVLQRSHSYFEGQGRAESRTR